jgi:hypothetical protein
VTRAEEFVRRVAIPLRLSGEPLQEISRSLERLSGELQVIVIGDLDSDQLAHAIDSRDEIVDLLLGEFPSQVLRHVVHHGAEVRALVRDGSVVVVGKQPAGESAPQHIQRSRDTIQLKTGRGRGRGRGGGSGLKRGRGESDTSSIKIRPASAEARAN